MSNKLPLLSVIIPVFNGSDTLQSAIASILRQDGADLEIIVVDDGSTDASADTAVACSQHITCVRQVNQGPAAARNRGLRLARGEFISFLDADDCWPVGRVRHHMELFEQAHDTEIVIGPTQMVSFSTVSGHITAPVFPAPLIQHHLASATYRSRLFERVGLFDPSLRIGEDKEWIQRAMAAGVSIQTTRSIALEYRMRKGSLTDGAINHGKWFLDALHADLKRRRSGNATRESSALSADKVKMCV